MMKRALTSLIIMVSLCGAAIAQQVNETVIAKQGVQLYATPPSGFPIKPGSPLFVANPGQKFRIFEVKQYKAVFYTDVWINILELDSPNPRAGWAYWGQSGKDSENFNG